MPSRKEALPIMEEASREDSLLQRIRNMWQFANLCQWIYIFGKVAKIDESLEIEDMETECLKPNSTILNDIGLGLLKLVSSHRGLTNDIFDEQLRKQYISKSPESNPLGDDDDARAFSELDVCTKIIVLQKLTQWAMAYPERIRDKMDEQKDTDQTSWRIEPYGWDSLDRTYFVLDDNRVYRMTEPPPPPPKTKKRKSYSSSRRSSKRRRTTQPTSDHEDEGDDEATEPVDLTEGLGGARWECVAISLDEVRQLVDSFRKSRDDNEKVLRRQLDAHLIPILEKQEESRKRKELQRERELLNLAKMANAKRSSRIANKAEQKEEEERVREEERKLEKEETVRKKEEEQRRKLEKERDSRLLSREKRLKEREVRRRIHEEELAQLSEDSKSGPDGSHRISERRLHAEIERNKQALQELAEEDEDWVFDCVCGLYGQIDDGTHSVACERCNIWQHSKCIGVSEREAEKSDFHFICRSCRKRIEEASTPRKTIKIKIKTPSHAEPSSRTSKNDMTPHQLQELQGPPAAIVTPGETNTADTGMRTVTPTQGRPDYAQQSQLMTTQNGNDLEAAGTSVYRIQQQGGSEEAQKPNSYGMAQPVLQDTSRAAVVESPHTVGPSPATDATVESKASTVPKLPHVSKQDPPMPATQARSIYTVPKSPSLASNALSSQSPSSLPSINPERVTNAINSPRVPLQHVLTGSMDAAKLEPPSSMNTMHALGSSASQKPAPITLETRQGQPPHTLLPPISSLPPSSAAQTHHRPQEQSMTSDGEHKAQ